ncbi:MAG: N-acetylmuramoyl-L-alanine amidase [Pseudomonadota bacterium]
MRAVRKLFTGICIFLSGQSLAFAAPDADFLQVRLWAAPDHTRVVFDTSAPVSHKAFTLPNPDRLVIDVPAARAPEAMRGSGGIVTAIRAAKNNPKTLRIVLELKQAVRPKSFSLPPSGQYGNRLVIDLYPEGAAATATTAAAAAPAPAAAAPAPAKRDAKATVANPPDRARDLVIAIDAGHGGDDPGAIGRRKTREKDVVLSIARKLAGLVEQEPGMRPVLIREGDYYIGLRQRIEKARKHKADMFISIHADGFTDHRASGSSVYVLSRRGASSEMARVLAARENAADLVGGVSLDDKDELLREVLLDLSQTATLEASFSVADNMLGELKRVGKTHKTSVQQAGFVVLKSPDIPSILVETAFISNPAEEQKLREAGHQQKLAQAMLRGIRDYFGKHPPPGTLMARQYVVKRGDTLSEIAAQFSVSLSDLRGYNSLKSDTLRVGDTLRIPPTQDS